jgi:hypothetical protein
LGTAIQQTIVELNAASTDDRFSTRHDVDVPADNATSTAL